MTRILKILGKPPHSIASPETPLAKAKTPDVAYYLAHAYRDASKTLQGQSANRQPTLSDVLKEILDEAKKQTKSFDAVGENPDGSIRVVPAVNITLGEVKEAAVKIFRRHFWS